MGTGALFVRATVVGIVCCIGVGMTGGSASSIPPGGEGRTVETWTQTLVDTTRPTEAGSATPELPERTLATTIYKPSGRGPFPLIVFSHGLDGHPDKFTELLNAWAEAGYVVAAPAFPLTNSTVSGDRDNAGGVLQQPADVSFVITQMLRMNRATKSRLHGMINPKRIGAGGLSLGGATTYGATFNDCCRDQRIRAAEVLDGIILGVGDGQGETRLDGHVPLLIVHSDTDPALPYATARAAFAQAAAPVWFVTLHGASHATQFENDPTPYDQIGINVTRDFWDATLRGDQRAFSRLEQDATVAGLSSIEMHR